MDHAVWFGILIPFIGTSLGAFCVYFLRGELNHSVEHGLTGFAAGVMTAASVWSLLIPAMEQSSPLGGWAFLPAVIGFWLGTLLMLALDHIVPHLHMYANKPEGHASSLSRSAMLVLAVTLHNIPEGMAVGVAYAGMLSGDAGVSAGTALALALGIAIQNLPEGAIISLPLRAEGMNSHRACLYGVMSGVVEPIAAALTFWAAHYILPVMPYLLSFAAGAMIYVVTEELIPEMSEGEHSHVGVLSFTLGFTVMMALDVALG